MVRDQWIVPERGKLQRFPWVVTEEFHPGTESLARGANPGVTPNVALRKSKSKGGFMFERNAVVAVYDSHTEAEEAVRKLWTSGFDMKKLSIVGKDHHTEDQLVGYYNSGGRMKYWGELGGFWGSIWGLLFGWAFFAIPGFGPVLVAGPLAGWILATLEDAALVGGLSVVGAALYSIGIPKDSALIYESALKADKFLLIAHGASDEVTKAKNIIKVTQAAESAAHAA